MINELTLAKVGVYDYHPNRRSAVKHLIKTRDQRVWYLSDWGLTYAYRNGQMMKSFTQVSIDQFGRQAVEGMTAFEHGFDRHQIPEHSIGFAHTHITNHALQRWNERCAGQLLKINDIHQAADAHSSHQVINNQRPIGEFFIPVSAGALVGIHKNTPLRNESVSEVKQRSFLGNYQWSKTKREWVGEFPRIEMLSIVTTFLGWDELKRGGVFNGADWYKRQMELTDANQKLSKLIMEISK